MLFFEPDARDRTLFPHNPFKGMVIPRPVGWISTMSAAGELNLAPYSYFNGFSSAPMIVGFSSEGEKDSQAFAEETGETPRDFVERIRIDAARSLFEEAQLPVQAVATRCGFETVDNLRRAFIRRLGVTPQQYRQRFRLADDEQTRAAAAE